MSEAVQEFRAITDDHALSEQEIKKYLAWGKGNLEQALNYYFRKKKKSQATPSQLPLTRSQDRNAFQTMRNASIRQNQTETYIKNVR